MTFLAAVLAAALVQASPAADTTDTPAGAVDAQDEATPAVLGDERPGLKFRPRIAPSALYNNNRGFGFGGGIGIENIGWPGSDLVVDVRLVQSLLAARTRLYTDDPFDSRLYGLTSASASTTDRRRYFGLGPNTLTDSEINLFHDAAQAEVRLGAYPLGNTALYLQPGVRFLYDYSGGLNEADSENTLAVFDERSREAVEVAEGIKRYGASVGVEIATDLRDWRSYPTRGFFGMVEHRRFIAFDETDLTLARYSGTATGYVPVRGRTTVFFTGVASFTRSGDGDGDGQDDPIPFYYLPTLDDRVAAPFRQERLSGRDILAGGVGIRAAMVDILGVYGIDGLATVYLGNAYDNVFEQFTPKISFEDGSEIGEDGRAFLRPAMGLGLGIVNLKRERLVIGGLLGIGPGGVNLATLRIAYDLRHARPLFR
ncbi:MAG: hypothetical protein AAGK21_03530 [Bacteroidota bacterium]